MMLTRLLPAILWTALIAWFSTDMWSASGPGTGFLRPLLTALLPWAHLEQIEGMIWLIRKGAHVTEYAVLAALWCQAFTPRSPARWRLAFGLSVLTAALGCVFIAHLCAAHGDLRGWVQVARRVAMTASRLHGPGPPSITTASPMQ